MIGTLRDRRRPSLSSHRERAVRPTLEGLEDRMLLYATNGGLWTYGSRITYSFIPDGTFDGGGPSNLFATLNASSPTATWQAAFKSAAAYWSSYANINMALVSDSGDPVGTNGNQQGDPRFGDIRIGMFPMDPGVLACAILPPPISGGSAAGDINFNSNINWAPGQGYDVGTVALHEMGHALGLDHSPVSTDVLYAYYNGTNQSLSSDDKAGVASIYGANPARTTNNTSYALAANLTTQIDSNLQIAFPARLANIYDNEYYTVTVPSGTTGTMTVSMQSTNLSSVAPKLAVYNAAKTRIGSSVLPNSYGATATVTINGVSPGQVYYFTAGAASGMGSVGSFGLLANFGSAAQPPMPPPYTVVAQQWSQGSPSMNEMAGPSGSGDGSATLPRGPFNIVTTAVGAIRSDMTPIALPDGTTAWAENLRATPQAAARAAVHPIGPISPAAWFGITGATSQTVVVNLPTAASFGDATPAPAPTTTPFIAPWTGVDPTARDAAFALPDATELSFFHGTTPWSIRNRHRPGD